MVSFSVFFDGLIGFGIQPVDAIDAANAVEIMSAIHVVTRFSAVLTSELEWCGKWKLFLV